MNRGYNVYYDVLNTYQYMALYRSRDPNFFSTERGIDMASATARGINALAELIATPAPAVYYACTGTSSTMYYPTDFITYDTLIDVDHGVGPHGETCAMTAPSALGLGDAEPLFLGFTEDFTEWQFSFLGTYWDKENSIFLLTLPSVRYVRVNGAEDYRNYSVSLFRVYRPEVLGLLEGLIRYDYGQIASRITDNAGKATLTPLNVVDPTQALTDVGYIPGGSGSATGQNVLPSVARNLQREALLFGLARLSSPLDEELDFSKYARVWVKGAVDELFSETDWQALPAADRAECQPESSQFTFRSLRATEGVGAGQHDIGWQLVTDCVYRQQQLADARQALADAQAAPIPDQRTIDDAQRKVDIADTNMGAATQMLQYTRMVNYLFEHGVEL